MVAGQHREIHDVQQSTKMVPLITCKTTRGEHVRDSVLGVSMFDLDFGVQVDSVNNQSNATRVSSLDFFLPVMIILITASLSSKMYN